MKLDDLRQRETPLELSSQEFRTLGYRLVDRIAGHFETLANRRITPGESPEAVRRAIEADKGRPFLGTESGALLDEITDLLLEHSLFNAHPRFWGYITAGPAPIGVLADLLASAVNSNVGAWKLANAAGRLAVDLGAGFGMHAIPLARQGYTVTAIDTSAELLSQLRSHSPDIAIRTVLADMDFEFVNPSAVFWE